LIYGQRLYDTKALVAAAYRYATRKRLRHSQFSGGEQTQAVFGRVARDDSSFNQIIDDRLGELRNLSTEYDRIPRPWPRANQPQVNVNIDVKAGYVIDLSPADEAERQMIERQAKIVGGGAVIDATAEPVRGIRPGGRKPD
jgi:hypothetical protein